MVLGRKWMRHHLILCRNRWTEKIYRRRKIGNCFAFEWLNAQQEHIVLVVNARDKFKLILILLLESLINKFTIRGLGCKLCFN